MAKSVNLDSARSKLAQAKNHLRNLKLSYKRPRTVQKAMDHIWLEYQPETRSVQVFADIKEPPRKWRLLLGDVVHNLRASLDHIAFGLAMQHGSPLKKCRRTMFPIYETDADYWQHGRPRLHGVIDPNALAAMRALQPYHTPRDPRAPLLWEISQLDNADKHRHLVLVQKHFTIKGEISWPQIPGMSLKFIGQTKIGASHAPNRREELFRATLPPLPAPPKAELEDGSMRIAFAKTDVCDGAFVIPKLRELIRTTESVINEFARRFFQ